ncbi:uncharacterized protein [Littorina saxatilis]|uniref:uncharacterized protein isoform X2 n=1 Tax=Littorina saxatilis TaxID=31220 RepID=UPI0038B61414
MQETGPRGDTQYTGDTENMEIRNTVITRSTQVKKDDSEQNDQAVRMSLRSNPAQNMSPSPVGNSTTSFAGDTTIGSAANNAVKNRAKESSSDASASETADEGPMESGEPHEGNENDQQSLGQKAADTCHKGAGVDTQSSLRLRPDQRENSEDENSLACQTPRLEQDNNPEEAWDVNGTIAESRTQTNITNTDSVIAEPGKDAMVTNTASSNEIADSCTETANHAEDVAKGILFKQEEEATDIEENKEALSVSERNEKTANKNGQTDMIPRAPPVKPEIITVRLQQSPHVQAGSLSMRENRAKATEITQLQDRTYKENNVQVNAVKYKEQQTSEIATAENETTAESFQLDTQPDSPGSSTKEDTNSRLYFVVDNGEGGYKVFQADGTEVTEPEMVAGGDAGTNSVVHLSVTDLQVPEDKEASEVKVETGVKGTQPYQIDPSLIPIKAIPAMSMLQPPQARGGDPDKAETFPYMPPDPTFMYMPEEGVMKSQPVPKPTRGRRGRRKSPTNLTPGLRLPVPCGLPLTQYPRQRVKRTYRRYNLPTSTALPSQYYTGVNSGGETDSQPPDAAGDMLGYKDIAGVSPRYGNTGWYWGDEYYAPQHQWYAERGRGRGRGRSRRGSGGVRQYLQHRLLWARYTGRSQEALDRVLTIINSKCSLKGEESKPVVGGKTWSRERAPEAADRQVLNDQRLDTATSSELQNPYDVYHGRNFSSNISNMMAGGGDTAKMSNAAEVAREGSAHLDSGYCQQSDKTKNIRNTPPRRLKTPVSPVKEQKAGKRQHSGGGNRKKRVRRSLTFSSPIKQEETLTATESLANVMKDSNDTEREDPSPAPTPTPLPSISSLLQSSNNTGISINIHLTNNDNSDRTSRTGGEETAAERSRSTVEHTASDCATRGDIGSRHVKGNTLHYPVPRYTVEWRGNYQDSGASDWFHPYQQAPPNIGSSYRNPYREPGGYYMMDRPYHPMDCYYTADYTKDWAGAYSKYPPNHFLPKYEPPQVAVSSAYPGWGRHSDVYADAHHDSFVARTTQASDTPYSYYHRAAPYQGKPGFADEAFLQSRDAAAIGERHSMQRLASNADSTSSYRLADRHEAVYGMHPSSDVHESAQEQQDMEGNVQNMSPQREPSVNLDSSLEGQRGDLQDQETVNQ